MQVKVTPQAFKQYKKLPKNEQIKIKKKIIYLEAEPFAGKKLSGIYRDLRSAKVWPYRIIYYIDNKHKKIFIVTIAHRQGVY